MTHAPALNRQRGSTILLVLAMLSILLLLAIAFSYGTRLESQASYNYARVAQARVSATTGLPQVLPMLHDGSMGITTPLQAWNVVPAAINNMVKQNGRAAALSAAQLTMLKDAGIRIRRDGTGQVVSGPQATVTVRDLSGLVNLNAIENEAAMTRVVQTVLPGGNVMQKSRALMTLRDAALQGTSRASRAREDDPSNNGTHSLDPRDPNAVLLDSLARLQYNPANTGQPIFTGQEIQKLEQLVTVFSQSPEVYNAPDGTHIPRISVHAIDPEVVYERLVNAFPHKDKRLLLQFAANVADFTDEDDEPTVLDSNGKRVDSINSHHAVENLTLGVEQVPMISEVYPDSATTGQHGDAGQFVEITNPWDKTVNLVGWRLKTSNGNISLTTSLPPRGILVITDNLNTPSPDAQPGQGSLVSIFGATPDGTSRKAMTVKTLDLPDRGSQVELYDNHGQLVDVFTYGNSNKVDSKQSFQREDPLVRGWKVADATPFAPMSNSADAAQARAVWKDGNTTMTKLSQLFELSTGFATKGEFGQTVHGNQTATLTVPEEIQKGTDPYPNNLDLRLVDIFTISPPDAYTTPTELMENQQNNRNRADNSGAERMREFRERMARLRTGASIEDINNETTQTTTALAHSYGKLNVNTCPKQALVGISLGGQEDARGMTGLVEKFEAHRMHRLRENRAPFLNVSEFLVKFGPQFSRSNLAELDRLTGQVAVGSSSFEVVAQNRLSSDEQKALDGGSNKDGQRPATATAKWVISMDQDPYSILSFTLVP